MTCASLGTDPLILGSSVAVAAVGIHRLAVIAETDRGGPLHQLGRAARLELGPLEAVPPVALAAAVMGLGAVPHGQTKEERQIARSLMAFRALLRAWDRHDRGKLAALRARTDRTVQRWATATPVVMGPREAEPAWASRRDRPAQR
jgi:hypothetical protein